MATSRISFSNSDDEVSYSTISTAPPKRRAGRTKFRETRHPIYKGVRLRNSNRWVCEVREPNKKSRIWLGTFQTADMAARAHDVAAMALRGKSACLNFADSPKLLRVPESTSPRSIQRAAAMAAEMFRPKSGNERNEVVLAEALQIDPFLEGFELGEKDYADMAHGMLIDLPPPPVELAVEDGSDADEGVSLWNYSL